MDYVAGIILYVIIWWTLIFSILPWGNKGPSRVSLGHASGAPEFPRLVLKFFLNTLLSTLIWALIYWGVGENISLSNLFDLYPFLGEISESTPPKPGG